MSPAASAAVNTLVGLTLNANEEVPLLSLVLLLLMLSKNVGGKFNT